jgi:hypothetical protein
VSAEEEEALRRLDDAVRGQGDTEDDDDQFDGVSNYT